MLTVDLNCDMGEGCPNDAELMRYVSSANIACGYHAGDAETMRRTVDLALAGGVAIGVHPGYSDRENFGRTSISLPPEEVIGLVAEQIRDLNEICVQRGARLHHVKPHGALYNQAAKDKDLATAIAEVVASFDSKLILYGLSGSFLISEAESAGLITASEVFADRTYRPDGTLTPRSEPNALITDVRQCIEQVLQMVKSQTVAATDGSTVGIKADTICVHGDGEHAVDFARAIREALSDADVGISSRSLIY
jgi:5-oxoprolinase (ATP-hydrolysing) subunit A